MTLESEDQLQLLKDFANSENKKLVDKLEDILDDVGKTGQYIFPWNFMKPLYYFKLDQVTSQFLELNPPLNTDGTINTDQLNQLKAFRTELLLTFNNFVCAPFTIQRVTELLSNPKRHYKSTAKFFRGLEKNIMVISTIEMVTPEQRTILKRQLEEQRQVTENGNGTIIEDDLKPPVKKMATAEMVNSNNQQSAVSQPVQQQKEMDANSADASTKTTSETSPSTTPDVMDTSDGEKVDKVETGDAKVSAEEEAVDQKQENGTETEKAPASEQQAKQTDQQASKTEQQNNEKEEEVNLESDEKMSEDLSNDGQMNQD